MANQIFTLILPLLLLTTRTTTTTSQPPPPPPQDPPLPPPATEFLDTHNQARAEVGVPPLTWSQALANATSKLVRYQRDKMGCQFANLSNAKYGGNQLWASGSIDVSPNMAVDQWIQEKKYYNYNNNSCIGDHKCGVYTQVVWRKSLELGCAQAKCVKDMSSLTICFYNPPGNIIGERPY